MRRDDVRFAMAARDDGMRKISRFTWRAGAVGVVCSALIAAAFGHSVAADHGQGNGGQQGQGAIIVPAEPPAPAQGAGQVTSGAS
ncbi:MAG: hypothetical protein ABSB01_09145 [Streptosporangiaceae bacterium]|jgi:hypothetical protein